MKRTVYVLTTGGTIGTQTKGSGGAELMDTGTMTMISHVKPREVEIVEREVMRKGSPNIGPEDWVKIAEAVADALKAGPDGIVVTHGTATMHWTASALSFMLRNLSIPIILTGSNIPGGDPGSDALINLKNAIIAAALADVAEVCIVFSADPELGRGAIIRGCRARKTNWRIANAFQSLNVPPIGYVKDTEISYTDLQFTRRADRKLNLFTELNTKVVLIKFHPGLTAWEFTRLADEAAGVVIEGTADGLIRFDQDFVEAIASFKGPVVLASAGLSGQHFEAYKDTRVFQRLKNVILVRDMNTETALCKLMWALGQGDDVREAMLTNIAGELS